MRTLNLGIVAHVDAGKTSLTERVLFESGVLDAPGSVDGGDTRTDSTDLERRRGITIRAAVVAFAWRDATVNLLDTPGHSDFVAEVERALAVLDAAVLVVSAVEGVQAQTLVLMRALQRLRLPSIVFVNKVDRAGADPDRVLAEVEARLTPGALALGSVAAAGSRDAAYLPFPLEERELAGLRRGTITARTHPVVFGSAITGAGVTDLLDVVADLGPLVERDPSGPACGVVFKVERDASGSRGVLVRLHRGTLRVRDRVAFAGRAPERVTGLDVHEPGGPVPADEVGAGRIAVLRGVRTAQIGDRFGTGADTVDPARGPQVRFIRPSLETVVVPDDPTRAGALFAALTELADEDPLIGLRHDDGRHETSLTLYGEVQKEVVATVLSEQYGVDVHFRPTTAICVERVAGTGSAVELVGRHPNAFLATVGLRVEPAPVGGGTTFALEVELGSMPPAFFTAVEESVHATLAEGPHGWAVPDVVVTMTHSGYWARQSHAHATFDKAMSSTAADFRSLTRMVLARALVEAGTTVCAPVHRFELEVPEAVLGQVLAELPRHRAVPHRTDLRHGAAVLTGELPADAVHGLQQRIPHLTSGEGLLTATLDHFDPVVGPPPRRVRVGPDPYAVAHDLARVPRTWPAG